MPDLQAGKDYNPETAKNLRSRRFVFTAHGEMFAYTLEIPVYILDRFGLAEMNKLHEHMNDYAATVVLNAMRGGYLETDEGRANMRKDVGLQLKDYMYHEFSKSQNQAGNAIWQVPDSLQRLRV